MIRINTVKGLSFYEKEPVIRKNINRREKIA